MKYFDIVVAYKKLEELSNVKDFHAKEQWAIYKLRQKLKPFIEFFDERSNAITDKYRGFADDNGIISGEPYENYTKEMQELKDLETDTEIEKITLPFVDGITFIMAESLEKLIEFIE